MADPRTRAEDLPGTGGPSIAAPSPAPLVAPQETAPVGGLAILSSSLNNFFGQASSSLEGLSKAADYAQRQEIRTQFYLERGYQQQKARANAKQGVADALTGNQNPGLASDKDYAEAFAKTSGQQHGFDLFSKWVTDVYQNAQPGDDLSGKTQAWLKQEYGNGTGNPDYDAAALSTFKGRTDGLFLQHSQNSVKAVAATGIQSLDSLVADMAKAGQLSPDKFAELTDRYRKLDPMNPAAAPLRLAHALVAGNDGTPAYGQRVSSWMSQPGTGVNGKSFQDSFPDEAGKVQKSLMADYTHVTSLDGLNAYQAVKEKLFNAQTAQDYVGVIADAEKTRQQYGGVNEFNTLRNAAQAQLDKFADDETGINSVDQMVARAIPMDPKVVNKYFDQYLKRVGVDPYATDGPGPVQAANIVAKLGFMPTPLKDNMSRNLEDPSSRPGQIAAFDFYRSLTASYGGDPAVAKRDMSDTAKAIFDYANTQANQQGDNLPQIFDKLTANMDALRQGKEITWEKITGQKQTDAESAVHDRLLSGLKSGIFTTGLFPGRFSGESVVIDPLTEKQLTDTAKVATIINGRQGQDWGSAVDQTIQNAKERLEIIPGMNGAAMVRFKTMADTGPDGTPLVHFGASVVNPSTRKTEDTLSTFRADVSQLSDRLPGLVPDKSTISVATQSLMPGADRGVYQVLRDGRPLMVAPGQTIAAANGGAAEKVTLGQMPAGLPDVGTIGTGANKGTKFIFGTADAPANYGHIVPPAVQDYGTPAPGQPHSAIPPGYKPPSPLAGAEGHAALPHGQPLTDQMQKLLPQLPNGGGWVLVPNDPASPTGYYIGYRPRLTGSAPSLEDRAAGYQGSKAQQLRNDAHDMPIPMFDPGALQ